MTRRSLGKISDGSLDLAAAGGPGLRLVQTARPSPMEFPFGAQTRTVDDSGRLKLHSQPALAEVLAWQGGSLDAVVVEGWLVLRQPPHLVGASASRYSSAARYVRSAAGLERITLKPSHLEQLGVSPDWHLLVAVAPAAGALVVVNPSSCLLAAPGVVLDALGAVASTP
jgi:hypothetical protein